MLLLRPAYNFSRKLELQCNIFILNTAKRCVFNLRLYEVYMKKRIFLIMSVVCILALAVALVACDGTSNPSSNSGNPPTGDNNPNDTPTGGDNPVDPPSDDDPTNPPSQEEPTELTVYLQVDGNEPQKMQLSQTTDAQIYTLTLTLSVGNHVSIFDSNDVVYKVYNTDFDGLVKIDGEYVFTLKITGDGATIFVDAPEPSDSTPDPVEPDPIEPDPTPPKPQSTKVTVYYTNSERWANVYVYMWNYKTNTPKRSWPGEKLTVSGTSAYGEKQYSVEVDYTQYDRIIFNDGGNRQTKDLAVGRATSGYYGRDGVFTMNATNYGKVQYFTLKDTKNLQYIASNSKKVSVYTPSDYTPSKKYGVLYMFDSQNLYAAADGAQASHDSYGSWAVDVTVTNLVQNGNEGVIIVAIDNTDGHRDSELTMSQAFGQITNLADNSSFYNGKLDELGNFMKETLMPYIAKHYSVDTSREKTGIAGSSSGGLAAYYLGLRDNDLYGYIGAFSPANGLFTTQSWLKFYSGKDFSAGRPKIYVYCGTNDNGLEDMLLPATKEITKLTSYGFAKENIVENYVKGGTHSENYWRIAFVDFLSKSLG